MTNGDVHIVYTEPQGKFSPNGQNFLPEHPPEIKTNTWSRCTVAVIRSGQPRAYADSVAEAELLFEGGCGSSVAGCDLPFFTKPSETRVKDVVRALVGSFSDTPGQFDTRLAKLECVTAGRCHSLWRVQLVTPHCD